MKVYQAIASALRDEGVESVFALVGNANYEIVNAFNALEGTSVYAANIEGTAVGMADGYARATGRVGVCSTTGGPGMSNTVNALTSAARGNIPLVLVTGHSPDPDNHQRIDQRAIASLTGCGYREIEAASSTLDDVRTAFHAARTERRPIILDTGRGIQKQEYTWEYDYVPSTSGIAAPQPVHPAPEALERALDLIAESQRPVVIAGTGAIAAGAADEIALFADEIGAILSTSLHAKNLFAGDPYDVGVSGLFAWSFAMEMLSEADLVIGVGASLGRYTTEGGYLYENARYVQIDELAEVVLGNGRTADAYVRSDALVGVRALREGVERRGLSGARYRTEETRAAIAAHIADPDPYPYEIEPDLADPRELCAVVDELFPSECGVSIGIGHGWGFPVTILKKWRWPLLFNHFFGSVGIASPVVLGAAVGNPGRPYLLFDGDGAAMMTIHYFSTMAQYRLPVFAVILNDRAFGSELHQFGTVGLDVELSFLRDVDFAAVATAFGCEGRTVRNGQDMRAAAEEFLADPRPFVIDARVSRKVVNTAHRRLHYGIH